MLMRGVMGVRAKRTCKNPICRKQEVIMVSVATDIRVLEYCSEECATYHFQNNKNHNGYVPKAPEIKAQFGFEFKLKKVMTQQDWEDEKGSLQV